MELVDTIFIDLSYNTTNYIINALNYIPNSTIFQWYEISGNSELNLGTSSTITLNHTIIYSDGDKIRAYKCIINENSIIYFYVNYKTFFNRGIEYSLALIGNPIKLDISYASYVLEYGNSQLLAIGDPSGGIKPYKYEWYDGSALIGGENNSNYLIQHSFNIMEPSADISKSFYCHITNSGEALSVSIVSFDALFRAKPMPLNAIQNLSEYTLNVYEVLQLKLDNISGGRKQLSVSWERTYPGTEFVFYLASQIPLNSTETVLNISNTREFPINDGTILYKATLSDALGSIKTFTYNITYKGYYLSEPCIPIGTMIKAYNQNDDIVDMPIENITVGSWILSNNAKVKVQNIYTRSVLIKPGDLHILNGGTYLFKTGIVSSNGYVYNYINNVTSALNNQTVVFYQLETPNYLKYDIIVGNKYIKSYGNHDDSLAFDELNNGFITIAPSSDLPFENSDNIVVFEKPLYLD